MNELIKHEELLRYTSNAFKNARANVMEGARLLYQVEQEEAWQVHYSSFNEFVEQECQISKGYASKLLQAWKFYVVDNQVSQAKLEGIDAEKLYLALKTPGTAEEKLSQALTLSRHELKDNISEATHGDAHEHTPKDGTRYATCECGKFFQVFGDE